MLLNHSRCFALREALPLIAAAAVVLLVAAVAGGYWFFGPDSRAPQPTPSWAPAQAGSEDVDVPEASIAVLPFTNLNNNPEEDYYIDGITNDIITDLSHLSGLFVIASNSVFTYKGTPVNVREVGRDLGPQYPQF